MTFYFPYKRPLFVVDFETTGLNPDKDDVAIEIGTTYIDETGMYLGPFGEEGALLKLPNVESFMLTFKEEKTVWDLRGQSAYWYHRIPAQDVLDKGISARRACQTILDFLVEKTGQRKNPDLKPIITSDNANFEVGFMKKMFESAGYQYPFHYAGWDTNLILDGLNIGDPKPVHRAQGDCQMLTEHLLIALQLMSQHRIPDKARPVTAR